MPEGDAVYLTARRLNRALAGKTLTGCDIRVPRYATVDLSGERVHETATRGKHLLTRIGDYTIHTHLKMEGRWRVYKTGERWRKPGHHARIVLTADETQAVGFQLGKVEVLPRDQEDTVVGHLGPDLLGADWDPEEAVRRLARQPDRPIALALLDQTNLAGIGNIYRSEICFLAKVDPRLPVKSVKDLPALVDQAHKVLTAAAHHPPWRAYVYQRQRLPCRRCGTNLTLTLIGEGDTRERGIYFCTGCQL